MTINRRTVLTGTAALAGTAALGGKFGIGRAFAQGASVPTYTPEEGATLRLLRWVPFVKAEEEAWNANTAAFTEATGIEVETNVQDNETFQESINSYLQGTPQDVFTWFAGFRARFFDDQGFIGDISDVWDDIGDGFTEGFKEASSNGDKQIFVPLYNYPWAMFYRKSVFEEKGYTPPANLDEFKTLAAKMQTDGLIPMAFGP